MGLLKEINRRCDWVEARVDDGLRLGLRAVDSFLEDSKKPRVLAKSVFLGSSVGLIVVGCGGLYDNLAGITLAGICYLGVHYSGKSLFSKTHTRNLPHD